MKRNIFFIMLLAIIFACSSDDPVNGIDNPEEIVDNPEDNTPEAKTDIFFTPYTHSGIKDGDYSQYWGTGQKEGTRLRGDSLSADRPVIDIERVFTEEPHFFEARKLLTSEYQSFVVADPKQYVQVTSFSDKGLDELLPSGKLNRPGRLFAEVVNERIEILYRSMASTYIKGIIAEKYLLPEFLDKLHHNSIDKVIDDYGSYLLMNFVTGYKTVAFYTGLYRGEASDSEKKAAFYSYISGINHTEEAVDKEGNTVRNEYIYTDQKSKDPNITDVEISIQNIGGGGEFRELSHLAKVDKIKVHLTPWAKTFNNDNLALIADEDQGLQPLYDFLLEENFKERAKEYIDENKTPPAMQEPRIEIVNQSDNGKSYLHVCLVTRFGDNVLIDSRELSPGEDATQLAAEIKEEKQKFYRLNILYREAKPSETIKAFSFNGMDETKMKKIVRNGMTYLQYSKGTDRYAFSVYDKQIMDAYGIKEWVDGMEESDKLYSQRCIFIGL